MGNLFNLLPVLLFLVGMLGISAYIQRASQENRQKDFAKDYFIGGRTLGGFVLAMTTAATYSSVSTFVGGPGMAWVIGYGWLYMAIVQVIVIFLVLGVFGKKIALIAREIDAVTVIDVLRARYESNLLANMAALVMVAFFCSTMVAQFVGAAKLFEAVTGFSYVTGLSLFGLIVVIYTTIGGFKGVRHHFYRTLYLMLDNTHNSGCTLMLLQKCAVLYNYLKSSFLLRVLQINYLSVEGLAVHLLYMKQANLCKDCQTGLIPY